jgi:hypothetical protein
MQTVLCFQGVVGLEVTALNVPVPLAWPDERHLPLLLFGIALFPASLIMAGALAVRRRPVRGVIVSVQVALLLVFNALTVIAGIPDLERSGPLPDIVSGLLVGLLLVSAGFLLVSGDARSWFSVPGRRVAESDERTRTGDGQR